MSEEVIAYHKQVSDLSMKVRELIRGETKDLPEKLRWLLIGRVINSLFSSFYQPVILQTEANILEKESALESKPSRATGKSKKRI